MSIKAYTGKSNRKSLGNFATLYRLGIELRAVTIWLYTRPLNVMQLDEEQAQQLGINVERMKVILLVAASLITAAAVLPSFSTCCGRGREQSFERRLRPFTKLISLWVGGNN